MKKARKVMALCMVLVLALALSLPVSAFAANATVTFMDNGTPITGLTNVSVSGTTVYDALNTYLSGNGNVTGLDWDDVPFGVGTAKVLIGFNYNSTPYFNDYDVWEDPLEAGHWFYDGYAWQYYVNDDYALDYMDHYNLSEGDEIVVDLFYSSFDWYDPN